MSKPEVTMIELESAIMDYEYNGICTECGAVQGGCEPDARNYRCECCDEMAVFGIEQAMIENLVTIMPDETI